MFGLDHEPPVGSMVIERNTRHVLGSYEEMKSEIGNLRGEEKGRHMDGLIKF